MDKLKKILNERCINRAMLARKIGVSRETIDNWIHDRNYPNMKHLKQIAKILGIKVAEIFFNDESVKIEKK